MRGRLCRAGGERYGNVPYLAGCSLAYVAQYAFSTEFEWYPVVELPNPRLKKLGVEVGSIEEFARTNSKAYIEV